MTNILGIVILTLVLIVVFGGLGYLLWLFSKPKKITWKAKIYTVGSGEKPPEMDKDGNIISNIKLKDLKEFAEDIIVREEKEHGIVVYRLQTLNMIVPEVTGDVVENWGKYKEVKVLKVGDSCTLLKSGYDSGTGSSVFIPLPHDRMNLLTQQMAIRKERYKQKKDLLAQIMPFVMIVGLIIGIVGVAYILGNAFVDMSENLANAEMIASENYEKGARIFGAAYTGDYEKLEEYIGKKEKLNKSSPPSIE